MERPQYCKNLMPVFSNQDGMLPLRRQAAILGGNGPAIGRLRIAAFPALIIGSTVNIIPGPQFQTCLRTSIVQHLGALTKFLRQYHARKIDHTISHPFNQFLDGMPDVTQMFPRAISSIPRHIAS